MMATVLLSGKAVEITVKSGAELLTLATSKHVNRLRCPTCFSPVLVSSFPHLSLYLVECLVHQ
jgi:hypothetical protein